MPTYRCTAKCKSCRTLSSPSATERLSCDEVLLAIREAYSAGVGVVVFTGGEATLELNSLIAGLRLATELGLPTRLVTNAWWAEDETTAKTFLSELQEAGLTEINYSTGDQHVRFVSLENVLFAVRAALALNYNPCVMVESTANSGITAQFLQELPYQIETRKLFPGKLIKFNDSAWMPLSGKRLETYPSHRTYDKSNISAAGGCDSVIGTVTVQANGKLGACCGIGMRLIPELDQGLLGGTSLTSAFESAENDLLKRWIRAEGPEKILAWASSKDDRIQWEGRYAHRCQACLRMYKDEMVRDVIRDHICEKIGDIIFHEYLLYQHQIPKLPDNHDDF